MQDDQFYTSKGYETRNPGELSPAMEDYLEMICRHIQEGNIMRINVLASLLHVTPPSASKMVNKLKDMGYVSFQPYGYIQLTEKGVRKGRFLLERHNILHQLFCLINHSDNELETVELIEHYINEATIYNIRAFLDSLPG
ncbi:metal-dependent transcriptional regulator [Diplocloster hominis]|uniref:metal-dependent transcriptional regulator n=1 Tax=Diplocloster hominis TaxID=3079010 RepID=UPI0031BAB2F0